MTPETGRLCERLRLGVELPQPLKARDLLISPSLLCLCSENGQQAGPTDGLLYAVSCTVL